MSKTHGFHHMAMRVKDFDKTLRFYSDVLGMPVAKAWGAAGSRAAMLDTGSGDYIEVFEGRTAAAESEQVLHFALRVEDCDAVTETVRSAGSRITTEPKNVDIPADPVYPVRISFFEGPDGEIVELFQER